MEYSNTYALVAGGCFGLFLLIQIYFRLFELLRAPIQHLKRYIVYPYLVRRHRMVGPLTRGRFCLVVLFVAVNAFFCAFKASSLAEAGIRIGDIALVNMIPLYFGIHQSFVADLLGLRLYSYRFLHALIALACVLQVMIHSIMEIRVHKSSAFGDENQLYGTIVSCGSRP